MTVVPHLIIVILLKCLSMNMVTSQSLPESTLAGSACYGFHPFVVACDPSHLIAVRSVSLAAKLKSLTCPPEVEVWNGEVVDAVKHLPINNSRCCEVQTNNNSSSCSIPHTHSTYRYRRACSGYPECLTGGIPVERRPTFPQCDQSLYMTYTNFLHMDYYCINRSRIASVCAPATQTITNGETLYIQSPSYPNNISSSLNSTQCYIQTNDSGSSIHVYTIDVHLAKNGSDCQQSLNISTSSGHVLSWTCDNHTQYNITNTTLSDGNLQVNFTNNMSIEAGRFWIGFQASKAGVNLTMTCFSSSQLSCLTPTTTAPTNTTASVNTAPNRTVPNTTVSNTTPSSTTVVGRNDSSALSTNTYSDNTSQALPEPAFTGSACYGFHPFVVTCDPSHLIAVRSVSLAAKLKSLTCPPEVEVWNGEVVDAVKHLPINNSRCCEVQTNNNSSSCSIPHVHSTYRYRRSCTGYPECLTGGIPVERRPTYPQCDQSLYMTYTNFLHMDYYCINRSRLGSVCASTTQTTRNGEALYLQSPSYPADIPSGLNSTQCSVQTNDSKSSIHVYTIDVHLAKNGSDCQQSLNISTSSGHVLSWTCDNHTLYNITNTTLSGSHILINYTNSMLRDAGRFWIGFQASKAGVKLEMNCSSPSQLACVIPSPVSNTSNATAPNTTAPNLTAPNMTQTNTSLSNTTPQNTLASNTTVPIVTAPNTLPLTTIQPNTTLPSTTTSNASVIATMSPNIIQPTTNALNNTVSNTTALKAPVSNNTDIGENAMFAASTDQCTNGNQLAMIIAIVLGLLLLLVIIAIIIYCCYYKKKNTVITDENADADAGMETKPKIDGIMDGNVLISRAPVRTMFGSQVKLPGNQLTPTRFIMEHNGVQPMVPALDQNIDRPSNRLPPLLPASNGTASASAEGETARKKHKKKRRNGKQDQTGVVTLLGPQDDTNGPEIQKKRKKKNKKRKQVDIMTTENEIKS